MFASETDSICVKQAVVDGQEGMSDLGKQQMSTGMMDLALGFSGDENTLLRIAQLL